jgi:hypothetical protein
VSGIRADKIIELMVRKVLFVGFVVFSLVGFAQNKHEKTLNQLLDAWHLDATKADFNAYFGKTDASFVFLGTAPGERWNKQQFMDFSLPYFQKGKAWDFKASNRKWQFSSDSTMAWFDEDLDTWMKGCRGSGIVRYDGLEWKIVYYNLTVLIENEKIKEFIKLRD